MKVKYANGEVSSVRNDLGRELVRAGIAIVLEPDTDDGVVHAGNESYRLPKYGDARIPQPSFSVELLHNQMTNNRYLAVVMVLGEQRITYIGPPKEINDRVTWPGGGRWLNGFGRECPADVAKEYDKRWKENDDLRVPKIEESESANEAMKFRLAQENG